MDSVLPSARRSRSHRQAHHAAQTQPEVLQRAPEAVVLRSATQADGHAAVLLDEVGERRLILLVNQVLPMHAVYHVDRPTRTDGSPASLFRVAHSHLGNRAGEPRLGHVLHVLERLRHAEVAWLPAALHPVLEQAALDFSAGQIQRAEDGLLRTLQQTPPHDAAAQLHQALLDLYWATGQQDKRQAQALAFARRCGRAPVERPAIGQEQREAHRTASFTAPQELDPFGVRTLQRAIMNQAGHLVLDFSGLRSIAADAREPLSAALSQIHARQVELELHGQDCLLSATHLRSIPAEEIDRDLRLQVLRLCQDAPGFVELAAQHAAASASAPRVWMPVRFTRLHPDDVAGETVAPGLPTAGLHPSTARLGDEIVGGDEAFLHALRTLATHAHTITVDLKGLRRMDFVAATALSNWVDAQQGLGKRVTLRGAHALLAPLLQAVGLPIQA